MDSRALWNSLINGTEEEAEAAYREILGMAHEDLGGLVDDAIEQLLKRLEQGEAAHGE